MVVVRCAADRLCGVACIIRRCSFKTKTRAFVESFVYSIVCDCQSYKVVQFMLQTCTFAGFSLLCCFIDGRWVKPNVTNIDEHVHNA